MITFYHGGMEDKQGRIPAPVMNLVITHKCSNESNCFPVALAVAVTVAFSREAFTLCMNLE
jgi:hypothetical protein